MPSRRGAGQQAPAKTFLALCSRRKARRRDPESPQGTQNERSRQANHAAACPPKLMRKHREGGRVRNLAYLALIENDQSSVESRICEVRYVCSITRGVSSIRVFSTRRVVVPRSEHRCEGTPLFLSAPEWFVSVK